MKLRQPRGRETPAWGAAYGNPDHRQSFPFPRITNAMTSPRLLRSAAIAAAVALGATRATAQDAAPRAPISIGDYPNVTGLRINFRDRGPVRVPGVNVTMWAPASAASSPGSRQAA